MGVDSNLTGVPQFNRLEIVKTGVADMTLADGTSGSSTAVVVNHNLGYIPVAIGFLSYETSYYQLPAFTGANFDTGNDRVGFNTWIYLEVSSTQLIIHGLSAIAGTQNVSIKYYLLRETANTNS